MWPRPYRARYFYNALSDENLDATSCGFTQFCLGEVPIRHQHIENTTTKNGPYEKKESFAMAKNIVWDKKWTVTY